MMQAEHLILYVVALALLGVLLRREWKLLAISVAAVVLARVALHYCTLALGWQAPLLLEYVGLICVSVLAIGLMDKRYNRSAKPTNV